MADQRRRTFLRYSALGIASLPLGIGVLSTQAFAQTLPRLEPSAPNAQALNYVESAAEASDHPAFNQGERCDNCLFYKNANEGCQLFPENSVAPSGWCQSWTARA